MLQNWARQIVFGVLATILLSDVAMADNLRLMMVERPGCHWCARWNQDIGPIYPKTPEGRAAPLLRHDVRDPLPAGITVVSPPQFTPTFILLQDGTEIGRIDGYPGEDFFWGLLAGLLTKSASGVAWTASP